ncbi:capreomycidine synthase [Actinosynnema sp. NPDC050801]|uniref:capreomycidine synthase n=1 Tax=unclassified Actinosynnema TaxID=2637065 RepID=UPI00340D06C2
MLGNIAPSALEEWLRTRYFSARVDISSSGVENYSLGDLRELLDIPVDDLDDVVFRDSPSLGGDALRAAVGRRFGAETGKVMITNGSSEALLLAMSALLRPGDEVVVQQPAYPSLRSIAQSIGVVLKIWECDPTEGFRPDLDRLAGVLSDRTKAVVVNFPHNPLGVTLDHVGYQALLDLVDACGAYLLWDAAFAELVYDAPPLPEPGAVHPRALSFGTLSKAYGLPGLRVGWCIGPHEVLDRMVLLRDYVSLNTSPLVETIATRVLDRADAVIGPRLAQARRNRALLADWAADNADLVDLRLPQGGVSAFPRLRGFDSVDALCADLCDAQGVLVVPGSCFDHPDRMRIGIGGPGDELADGLAAVVAAARRAARFS